MCQKTQLIVVSCLSWLMLGQSIGDSLDSLSRIKNTETPDAMRWIVSERLGL